MSSTVPMALVASVFTLGLVIIVHELGHFLLCKAFGIFVKTFSIGIGPKILRKQVGETEYVISLIPFGGYVKMAGEGIMEEIQDTGTWEERKYPLGTEAGNREAAATDLHIPPERHFNNRPAYQRFAVFVAGPLFNLLLAFLVYSGIILNDGIAEIPITRVGAVREGSPAAEAGLQVGDQILKVSDQRVAMWDDVLLGLVEPSRERPASPVPASLTFLRQGKVRTAALTPRFDAARQIWNVGLEPWDTIVGLVQKDGPADRMGLQEDDQVLALDGEPVTSFSAIAGVINQRAGQEVTVTWERNGVRLEGSVVPEPAEILPDSVIGRIFIDHKYVYRTVNLSQGLQMGVKATWFTMKATLEVLYSFVGGKLGMEAVGGPIRIGQVAGEMLRWGFTYLMRFIAFFSVNLFLLNLLPIPVLDGGHVLFLFFEVMAGRKVPERIQAIATQVGLIILLLFMTFVLVVDVLKVTGH